MSQNFIYTIATAMEIANKILSDLTAQKAAQEKQPLTNNIEISYYNLRIKKAKTNVITLIDATTGDEKYIDKYTHINKVFTEIEEIETQFKTKYNMS